LASFDTDYVNSITEDTNVGLKYEEVPSDIFSENSNEVGNIIIFLGCDLL